MIDLIIAPLGYIMYCCYTFTRNFGVAIVLFTLISKIILLPLSIWVQKNSIKVVKMQPEINNLKVRYFGDQDQIAEEQSKIFKRYHYNPFADIIPLIIQLLLLMALIEVIYHPFNYLIRLTSQEIDMLMEAARQIVGIDSNSSSVQLTIADAIRSGQHQVAFSGIPENILNSVQNMNLYAWIFNLVAIPAKSGGIALLTPILAGVSAWLLCTVQNHSNVLQSEQSNWNKYGMMGFSIALSLYLGCFVPVGVGLYWIASNLLAIVQLYLLNWLIDPQKHVDYAALEESKKRLAELKDVGGKNKLFKRNPNGKREKADYKRFFSIANKHLVFYSEESGFYKYYKGIIERLLKTSNIKIHYITSDPTDYIFCLAEKSEGRISPYYIGPSKLITLMMKMDADIVVMTMPDLENLHIKRSYIRKDIEYIYVPHGMDSLNMTMRTGSMDHYDTIFCVGPHQREEIEKTEVAYHLEKKRLVNWGYGLLDDMRENYQMMPHAEKTQKHVLVAPSWQEDNIMDICLEQILQQLSSSGIKTIVRPHPQYIRHFPQKMDQIVKRFAGEPMVTIQTDFSSNSTVLEADLLITDWSAIAYEFAYTTLKPVLFIDTPMKIMNPEYQRIDTTPINILLRKEIGEDIGLEDIPRINDIVQNMLREKPLYAVRIQESVQNYVYNLGDSNKVAAKYILNAVKKNA